MTREEKFMSEAIRLSQVGMQNNEGGPFGCVIVKDDEIIGRGWNRVLATNDPTAHAEVVAIRDACQHLGSFHLEGCELYTSCEPCPMCLGAIYWAQLKMIYYANTRNDADAIGFNDSFIYDELSSPQENRNVRMISLGRNDALKIFEQWSEKGNKKLY
ncbi:MAG: nucleoside deaminase [Bacteroidetes bacterium]|nr:nucleoside deaminase [Bacteroidota bacterium]